MLHYQTAVESRIFIRVHPDASVSIRGFRLFALAEWNEGG
jgi:hypothetical protein